MQRTERNYQIQSVQRALELLEHLQTVEGDGESGVSELSRALDLPKNNVFRLLATLQSRRYIEKNLLTERYRLGIRVMELGEAFIRQKELLVSTKPMLEEIVSRCNETAAVGIMQDCQMVNLDCVQTSHAVRVITRVGDCFPAHCTAAGKTWLAFMDEEGLQRHLGDEMLLRHTPNTITDRGELLAHLREIAQAGYAVDREEMEPGMIAVAAPIRNHLRSVVAAISVSAPASRVDAARLERELIPLIRKAGAEISVELGCR